MEIQRKISNRRFRVSFSMSLIDFNVTTKGCFWGVLEVVYYNPYYHAGRRIRPLADKKKDRIDVDSVLLS